MIDEHLPTYSPQSNIDREKSRVPQRHVEGAEPGYEDEDSDLEVDHRQSALDSTVLQ